MAERNEYNDEAFMRALASLPACLSARCRDFLVTLSPSEDLCNLILSVTDFHSVWQQAHSFSMMTAHVQAMGVRNFAWSKFMEKLETTMNQSGFTLQDHVLIH